MIIYIPLSIFIILIILENYKTIKELRISEYKSSVNISKFWKYSILIYLTGLINKWLMLINVYDNLKINDKANEIQPLIKDSLVTYYLFTGLSLLVLINWYVLRKYKIILQYK